ncbi:MAG: GTP 3',8-cyclase MoaA [bacterium]|nr:GTP 3',8-cyclase MoaA [bacterium]MDW8163598.1 GTP 3',8-cyclase MoaA [Candidatus Omnitrophota bacterium]
MIKDKSGRGIDTLRISITERCNFSCLYCSNQFNKLDKKDILSYEEIIKFVKIFSCLGIKKIKITGGEPLIRKDSISLIKEITDISGIEDISITTNGFYLYENIDKVREAGIKRINISLDTLNEKKFEILTGRSCLKRIKEVIKESCKIFIPVKLNVVIMRNINLEEICDFLNFASKNNLILKFIELMPVYKKISFWRENFVPFKNILDIIKKHTYIYPIKKNGRIKSYESSEGIIIEFVTPITEPFCNKCDRVRIDCAGNLFLCLYGKPIINLKKLDGDILNSIKFYVYNRDFSFNPFVKLKNYKLPLMNTIGG